MDDQDKKKFAEVMWGVSEDFGGKITQDSLKIRFNAMREFSIDQIVQAGVWLLKHRQEKFPAVPTTKEFIDAINLSTAPSPRVKAEVEADKVLDTLKEWGRDAEALFYDETTTFLMTKRWTFRKLDIMAVDDPGFKWWRKEFVQAYQDLEHDKTMGRGLLEITGQAEQDIKKLAESATKPLPA